MKSTFFTAALVLALAIFQTTTAATFADNVAVKVDRDAHGVAYNPILCHEVNQCGCHVGHAQCSRCPDDKGSKNKHNSVCWCSGLPHGLGIHGRECNPSKNGGPFKIDVDTGGNQYTPIKCDPHYNSCGCSRGHAECSKCPFDNGSQFKHENVW